MQRLLLEPQDFGVKSYIDACQLIFLESNLFLVAGDGEGVPCYVEPPVVAGHEFSGRVVKLGAGAGEKHKVKIGDLTVSEQIVPCEDCKYVTVQHKNCFHPKLCLDKCDRGGEESLGKI